ncbi:MAG: hypothetical protein ACYSW3_23860 [Planctomycetota bacterium]|jgi:hypothetical protein
MPIVKLGKIMEGFCLTPVNPRMLPVLFGIMVIMMVPAGACGVSVVEWDFSKGNHGWTGNDRVENLRSSAGGLIVKSTGQDPWIEGPAVDLPGDKMVRVKIRMKSTADPHAELFYGRAFVAGRSLRFSIRNDGQWHDYSLIIKEKLGAGTRFRLDPCTDKGELAVAFISVETLSDAVAPLLEKPKKPDKSRGKPLSVKSGKLEFEHYGKRWGNYVFKVDGVEMAAGYGPEQIGLLFYDQPEWLNLKNAEVVFGSRSKRREFTVKATVKDSKGGEWVIQRSIRLGKQDGTLAVEVELKVNKDRDVLHISARASTRAYWQAWNTSAMSQAAAMPISPRHSTFAVFPTPLR